MFQDIEGGEGFSEMKIKKESRSAARKLFRSCMEEGRLDESRVRAVVKQIGEQKPRGYLGVLTALEKLVKAEVQKYVVCVESSRGLETAQMQDLVSKIQQKFPVPLIPKQSVNPALVGGLRIKIGSNVWDGTVSAKLKQLEIE